MFTPAWPLTTERLVVRPFREDDFESMLAIHSDEGVARWLYNEPRDADGVRELLVRKIAGSSLRTEGDWLAAAITAAATGELVGDLAFHWVSEEHRTGEIGFIV